MKLSWKNIMRNVTPSLFVLAVGLAGALGVYNVYFGDRVANSLAGYEPAAGQGIQIAADADFEETESEYEETIEDLRTEQQIEPVEPDAPAEPSVDMKETSGEYDTPSLMHDTEPLEGEEPIDDIEESLETEELDAPAGEEAVEAE